MNNSVKLIGHTIPYEEYFKHTDIKSITDLIAYCARVSNPTNQLNTATVDKLIGYLLEHKHFSPFEMCNAVLEIETTRDIARQILRHRSFSFQEFSQRYADPTKGMSLVNRETRLQDTKNRQNSIDTDDDGLKGDWDFMQKEVSDVALASYKWALENGIAKEVARAVLPEGMMMSRMYMNGTIRSWIHYIEVRTGNGTQKEHIDVARKCAVEIAKIFPLINNLH